MRRTAIADGWPQRRRAAGENKCHSILSFWCREEEEDGDDLVASSSSLAPSQRVDKERETTASIHCRESLEEEKSKVIQDSTANRENSGKSKRRRRRRRRRNRQKNSQQQQQQGTAEEKTMASSSGRYVMQPVAVEILRIQKMIRDVCDRK